MTTEETRAIVLVVGRKAYHFQGGYDSWKRARGKKVNKPLFLNAPRIYLPRQYAVEINANGVRVRVQATLRLTPPYHHHARWFAGNPMTAQEYISQVVPDHLRGWLHYAILEDKPVGESVADFISRLDPTGIILPGRIYRVTSLEVHAVDATTQALASEGI